MGASTHENQNNKKTKQKKKQKQLCVWENVKKGIFLWKPMSLCPNRDVFYIGFKQKILHFCSWLMM